MDANKVSRTGVSRMTDTGRWRVTLGATPIALKPSLEGASALLCGCIAAGWNLRSEWLRVLTIWLIADVVLGCILGQLTALKRVVGLRQGDDQPQDVHPPRPMLVLPYATPGSPGYRWAAQINAYLAHWRDRTWPNAGQHAMTALVCAGLALLLATYLGREVAGAVSVGLVLASLLTIVAGASGAALERWFAGLHVALAWALGHLAFAPWQAPSMGLALLVGLGALARCGQRQGQGAPAAWLRWGVWWALASLLLIARQPVLAAVVGVAAWGSYAASAPTAPADAPQGQGIDRFAWIMTQGVMAMAVTYWL